MKIKNLILTVALSSGLVFAGCSSMSTTAKSTTKGAAIGAGAGLVLAVIYTVIRELCDNTFKSSEEIERVLNIPVLAGIPDYHFDDEKKGGKK